MDGLEVYQIYVALKSHFKTDSYDYFKYRGRMRSATRKVLDKRHDRAFFYKLGSLYPNREDIEQLFVANFLMNKEMWVGEFMTEEAIEVYTEYQKRLAAMSYHFRQDLEKVRQKFLNLNLTFENLNDILTGCSHPVLLTLYLRKEISLESLLIFDRQFGLFEKWNTTIREPLVWKDVKQLTSKYKPFIERKLENFNSVKITL